MILDIDKTLKECEEKQLDFPKFSKKEFAGQLELYYKDVITLGDPLLGRMLRGLLLPHCYNPARLEQAARHVKTYAIKNNLQTFAQVYKIYMLAFRSKVATSSPHIRDFFIDKIFDMIPENQNILLPFAGWGCEFLRAEKRKPKTVFALDNSLVSRKLHAYLLSISGRRAMENFSFVYGDSLSFSSEIKFDFAFASPPFYKKESYEKYVCKQPLDLWVRHFLNRSNKMVFRQLKHGGTYFQHTDAEPYWIDSLKYCGFQIRKIHEKQVKNLHPTAFHNEALCYEAIKP